ncbi:MAG: hypothetical protein EOM92_09190 [Gammaproteobacteria bacterium]|jgi:hypothetical protein|nr:hypothetical protein [Gammaproteobacteria bacterium]
MNTQARTMAVMVVLGLVLPLTLAASGGKNAYNNPNGSPADGDFDAPYVNAGDGRMLVFCDEQETLIMKPLGDGSIEMVCVPVDD